MSNWAAFVFAAVTSFFLAPFVVHHLGDTAYGVWALIGSLVGYMGLLDLGVRSAVMRYVARLHALADDAGASSIASAAVVIFLFVGAVAVVVSAGIAVVVGAVFKIPPHFLGAARAVVLITGFSVAVTLLSGVWGGIVTGLQRFDLNSGLEIAVTTVRVVAVVAALSAGYGLVSLSLIQLGCSTLRLGLDSLFARRLYPQIRIGLRGWNWSHLKEIFSFSIHSSVLQLAGRVIYATDAAVIAARLPVGMVTYFAIAGNLRDYATSVVSGVAQPLAPRASTLQAHERLEGLRGLILSVARIGSLVEIPIALTLLLRGTTFIGLWMGPRYAPVSGQVLLILAVGLLFGAARHVSLSAVIGMNQHRWLVPFVVVEAGLNLGLSLYWIGDLGIVGVALGTTIPSLVTTLIVFPWLLTRILDIPKWRTWLECWVRPTVALLPFAVGTWVVEHHWAAANLFVFFVQVAALLPLAAGGAWFVGLTREERKAVLQRVRNSLGQLQVP